MNIALVGAGPRNLTLVERLMAHAKKTTDPVDITLYDPFPIGGRVWNPDQDPTFFDEHCDATIDVVHRSISS